MGNTDSSNKEAEKFFVDTGNDINNNLIVPAGQTLNGAFNQINRGFNKAPNTINNSIDSINSAANKMTAPINLVADKLAISNTNRELENSLASLYTPIKTTLDTGFSKDNMQVVNDAFEDNLTKENLLVGTPYAVDSTFLLLNATPQGRLITTGLSLVGVDAATVDGWIGVEPSPVYIVGNAILDGVFSLMMDPQGGIEGITGFLQNPSLDALGKFAGIIPRELGGTYGTESGNSTRWYLEMGIVVIGGVYIYKRINRK
jgi:hypothetical protein